MDWVTVIGLALFLYTFARGVRWVMVPLLECTSVHGIVQEKLFKYGSAKPFQFLRSEGDVDLSIIVPAFNEAERILSMLDETCTYLSRRSESDPSFTHEIVVVDDGSTDLTAKVVLQYATKLKEGDLVVMKLERNVGKGGAVQRGVLHCRGKRILMADADAATNIEDLSHLESALDSIERHGMGIVVGSRAHLQEKALVQRKWYRNLLMLAFHQFVSVLATDQVKDTQCGFKLFSRKSALLSFVNLHISRWAFDVEILYIAKLLEMPVAEVPVRWTEIPGSKLSIIEASLQMARDLIIIRLCYLTGWWKLKKS